MPEAPSPTPPHPKLRRVVHSWWFRLGAPLALVAAVVIFVARLDLRPTLAHVAIRMLSGDVNGNYHAIVERLATVARDKGGRIDNVASEGSVANVAALASSAKSCETQFGLVQAGTQFPETPRLELVARLARAESMFILGKDADKITDFASLKGLKIAIGPEGSGTARVAREIFQSRDFAGLGLELSTHPVAEQLELAQKAGVDLAVFVIDEDSTFIDDAIRVRGLQMVGFPHADVIARRFPYLRHGRIGAGQYDPVRMLPPVDKQVIRVETFVVANGCARRSQTLGLLSSLSTVFPDLVRHNRDTPNTSGLELATPAKSFFEHEGLEVMDEYLPRIGDVMPPSNWVHVVMGVSILFNLMGVANRFRLWRIDAARVRSEQEIALSFGPNATLGDIARIEPEGETLAPRIKTEVDRVIADLEALAARSRRQSLSVLVPMGGEMAYRYQERMIHETLAVLRAFRARFVAAEKLAS